MKQLGIIPLEVYTDGSCKKLGKQTFGGWAYVIVRDGEIITAHTEGFLNTTNQRMELMSALEALRVVEKIKRPFEKVIVYSDSAYLINCFKQKWYENWRANGWRNSKKEDVANQDLWAELIPYFEKFNYNFEKVKGHAENFFNNKCDTLAQLSADQEKTKWRGKMSE